jgi:hypothetical protein
MPSPESPTRGGSTTSAGTQCRAQSRHPPGSARAEVLRQPVPVEVAALGLIEVITAMCYVIAALEAKPATVFDHHTQATVTGFPGVGPVHGGHVLGKIGDDPHPFADAAAVHSSPPLY